jgi:hypothetical protein
MYSIKNAIVTKAPYEASKKWYMQLKLDDEQGLKVYEFEKKYQTDNNIAKFQHSIYMNHIVIKIPFRYNKFECNVIDKFGDFSSCYEVKQSDIIECKLEHAGFSNQQGNILSTWKTKNIKVI